MEGEPENLSLEIWYEQLRNRSELHSLNQYLMDIPQKPWRIFFMCIIDEHNSPIVKIFHFIIQFKTQQKWYNHLKVYYFFFSLFKLTANSTVDVTN